MSRGFRSAAAVAALLLATMPIFFDTFRTAAFGTIPRDDYAPYLLALVGQGGSVPVPPFAYRVASVAAAVPFYHLLPLYSFSNLPATDPRWLRATEAIVFVSWASEVLTALALYALVRRRFAGSRAEAAAAACATFALGGLVSRAGVDPLAVLLVAALLLALDRPWVFGALALLSIGTNEKVPILFATVLAARAAVALVRRRPVPHATPLAASCLAVAGYVAWRFAWRVPGNEGQVDPGQFLVHLRATLAHSLTLKGMVLNVVPAAAVALLAFAAGRAGAGSRGAAMDLAGPVVLVLLAGMADVAYNVGRIAMYSYPFFLPAAATLLDRAVPTRPRHPGRHRRRSAPVPRHAGPGSAYAERPVASASS